MSAKPLDQEGMLHRTFCAVDAAKKLAYQSNSRVSSPADFESHYHPVELFGGEKGYAETICRDNSKKEWCRANGVKLIEIRYNDDIRHSVEVALNGL